MCSISDFGPTIGHLVKSLPNHHAGMKRVMKVGEGEGVCKDHNV